MSFDRLVLDLQTWMNNDSDEFVAECPGFVSKSESVLNRMLVVRGQIVTLPIPLSGAYFALPDRFLEMVGVRVRRVGTQAWSRPLEMKMPGYMDEFWPDDTPSVALGTDLPLPPRHYAIKDVSRVRVAPCPDGEWEAEVTARVRPEALGAANQENWWSVECYDALFAVAMYWAALFVRDDSQADRVNQWKGIAKDLGVDIAALDQRGSRDDFRQPTTIAENRPS